jgi:predicted MFS family arabinose efflux permease
VTPGFLGWKIVGALGATTIISYGTTQYLFSLLLEPVRAEFGVSRATLGFAYAAGTLVAGVAGVLLGPILDRWGARVLLACGSLVSAATLIGIARAGDAAFFVATWAVGTGTAAALTWYPVSFTVIANWFDQDRPRALARLTFAGALSSTIFYPLAGTLIAQFGWRGAVLILAAIQLAVAFPLHVAFVRRRPEDLGLHPDGAAEASDWHPGSGTNARRAVRSAAFWLVTAALACGAFASTAVLVVHVAFLVARGYPAAQASFIAGILGLAYLVGRWLFGWLAPHVSLTRLLAGALALAGAAVATLAGERGLGWVLAYVLVFGVAYGALAPLRGALVAALFGRRAYGTIIAAQGVVIAVAAAAGPFALGAVADQRGYASALGYAVAAFACGALVAATAGLSRQPVPAS